MAATESQLGTDCCDATRAFSGVKSGKTVPNATTSWASRLSMIFADFLVEFRTLCRKAFSRQICVGRSRRIEQAGKKIAHRAVLGRWHKVKGDIFCAKML